MMHEINVLEFDLRRIQVLALEAIFVAIYLLAGICIGFGGSADPKLVRSGAFHGLSVFGKRRVVVVA